MHFQVPEHKLKQKPKPATKRKPTAAPQRSPKEQHKHKFGRVYHGKKGFMLERVEHGVHWMHMGMRAAGQCAELPLRSVVF
mmetsp:Transcript_92683/g.155565  ORF Transcript_92683/g.155565 Transcript_92683/m.155565 type:complete len:81 (+) Transcript_92683:216-458(+)